MPTDQLVTPPTTTLTQRLSALQGVVVGLAGIRRHHYLPSTNRRENVAEHTLSVCTLAWLLHQEVRSATRLDTVLKYALVHDFVEVYAGDVNTFASAAQRQAKELREQAALQRFAVEFADVPDMLDHMRHYQIGTDPEARFVWTADKIQALLLGQMDNWRIYHELDISLDAFHQKYTEIIAKASPELQPFFRDYLEACKETYLAA